MAYPERKLCCFLVVEVEIKSRRIRKGSELTFRKCGEVAFNNKEDGVDHFLRLRMQRNLRFWNFRGDIPDDFHSFSTRATVLAQQSCLYIPPHLFIVLRTPPMEGWEKAGLSRGTSKAVMLTRDQPPIRIVPY